MTEILRNASLQVVPLLLGIIAHEVAHGWTAEKLGDPTARLMGRITFNPLVHIDLVGTIILPLVLLLIHSPVLFGWAKPVPVQFANLRGGRRGAALVGLAGPLTNFLLACLSALVYHSLLALFQADQISGHSPIGRVAEPVFYMARISVGFNLVLMVINLLPIPPLDGGRVAVGLLPARQAMWLEKLERFGMLIVFILIGTQLWGYIIQPVLDTLLRIFLR